MAIRSQGGFERMRRWTIRWFGKSKVTEWITAITALVGVLATCSAAYYLIHNGFLDQKKSELEAKKSEITIQNIKLEMDQVALLVKRDALNQQIETSNKRLVEAEKAVSDAEAKIATYTQHDKALEVIARACERSGLYCAITPYTFLPGNLSAVNIIPFPTTTGPDDTIPPRSFPETELVVSQLPNLRNLRALHVRGVKLGVREAEVISKLAGLMDLSLVNCGLDNNCLKHLTISQTLKRLNLSHSTATTLPAHAGNSSLENLQLHHSNFGDKAVAALLRDTPNIEVINVEDSTCCDDALTAITSEKMKALYLANSKVSRDGCKRLIARIDPEEIYVLKGFWGDSSDEVRNFLKQNRRNCRICLTERSTGGPHPFPVAHTIISAER